MTNVANEVVETKAKELTKRDKFRLEPVLLIQTTNPKKVGSMSHERYENYSKLDYSKTVTVGDCLNAGVRMDDIRHDSGKGYIAIGEANIKKAIAKVEADKAQAIKDAKALLKAEGVS